MFEVRQRTPVPWRTIWATIGSVVVTYLAWKVVGHVSRVLTWIVVALFFAIVLGPIVDFIQRRLHLRRALATLLVFLVGIAALGGLIYAFVRPLVDQSQKFSSNFPTYVADAKAGRGPVGHLVKKYNLDKRIANSQDQIKRGVNNLGKNSLKIVKGVGTALAATLTIAVLTFLMVLEGPPILNGFLNALEPPTRRRLARVANDASRAITGYMAGNLLISIIAGAATFAWLALWGVPFAGVLGLWVAFADLIPMVGATLGAIPTIAVAFLHSTPAGIATIIFYVVYQQFENHVLQVSIMSRTVALNPLAVLVSELIGVDLFGFLGALLAIPVAGVIQVIGRDIYDTQRGEIKDEPTVGEDEIPVTDGDPPVERSETADAPLSTVEANLAVEVPDAQ
jgi:predicted PurR-regulated permease PerM